MKTVKAVYVKAMWTPALQNEQNKMLAKKLRKKVFRFEKATWMFILWNRACSLPELCVDCCKKKNRQMNCCGGKKDSETQTPGFQPETSGADVYAFNSQNSEKKPFRARSWGSCGSTDSAVEKLEIIWILILFESDEICLYVYLHDDCKLVFLVHGRCRNDIWLCEDEFPERTDIQLHVWWRSRDSEDELTLRPTWAHKIVAFCGQKLIKTMKIRSNYLSDVQEKPFGG